ncbi:MAG: hypothetical protein KAU28_11095 [Phycisphaerae bacterium]|nr:hypothetical protein [Phycisphaerae bacterium]
MAEAKARDEWNHTSAVLAMLANVNRDPKKGRGFRPDDFNPYAAKRKTGIAIRADNIGILKQAFVGNRRSER